MPRPCQRRRLLHRRQTGSGSAARRRRHCTYPHVGERDRHPGALPLWILARPKRPAIASYNTAMVAQPGRRLRVSAVREELSTTDTTSLGGDQISFWYEAAVATRAPRARPLNQGAANLTRAAAPCEARQPV